MAAVKVDSVKFADTTASLVGPLLSWTSCKKRKSGDLRYSTMWDATEGRWALVGAKFSTL